MNIGHDFYEPAESYPSGMYQTPTLEMVRVAVENGFQTSPVEGVPVEDLEDDYA